MIPITLNLTLEQVLEFVHNLPMEYKGVVKKTLNEEKPEEQSSVLHSEMEEPLQSTSVVDEAMETPSE